TELGQQPNVLGIQIQVDSLGQDSFAEIIQHLVQRLETVENTNKDLDNRLSQTIVMVNERNHVIDCLRSEVSLLKSALEHVQQQQDIQSFNDQNRLIPVTNEFRWHISDIFQRIYDAQPERQPFVDSHYFQTSINGYKMFVRVYLNGNDSARQQYMSIFLKLCPNQFDSELQWPFCADITFCLIDQLGQNHITQIFRCSIPRGTSMGKGIRKFYQLNIIHRENNPYVHNDTMKIHIRVQNVTFDALSHIHQAIRSMEKRVQQDDEQQHSLVLNEVDDDGIDNLISA
ncbi:unnamed protein product, partial [Didymodactylos carnosus]